MSVDFSLNKYGKKLSTRELGREVKKEFDNIYNSCNKLIVLDFQDINLVTNSFADEFIGKKIIEVGFDNFKKRTTFMNVNDFINISIVRAINNRLLEMSQTKIS